MVCQFAIDSNVNYGHAFQLIKSGADRRSLGDNRGRRGPMRSNKQPRSEMAKLARIGGLAVAAGFGAALATGHGVASAEPSASDDSSPSSSSQSSSSSSSSNNSETRTPTRTRPAAARKAAEAEAKSDAADPKSDDNESSKPTRPGKAGSGDKPSSSTTAGSRQRSDPDDDEPDSAPDGDAPEPVVKDPAPEPATDPAPAAPAETDYVDPPAAQPDPAPEVAAPDPAPVIAVLPTPEPAAVATAPTDSTTGGTPVVPTSSEIATLVGGVYRELEHLKVASTPAAPALPVAAAVGAVTNPPVPDIEQEYYSLFSIYNLSSRAMTLTNIDYIWPKKPGLNIVDNGPLLLAPQIGTVTDTGEKIIFQLSRPSRFQDGEVQLTFKDTAGNVSRITIERTYWQSRPIFGDGGKAYCNTSNCIVLGSSGQSRRNVLIVDPGDKITDASTFTPERQQKIANLCGVSGITCTFANSKTTKGYAPAEVIGNEVANESEVQQSMSISMTVQKAYQNSIKGGVKAGADLFSLVKAEVSVEYTHQWTTTYTHAQTISINVPANTAAWVEAQVQVYEVRGDLIINTGDRTFNLKNVMVQVPIKDSTPRYTIKSRKLPKSSTSAV
ncbi:hypothetical protein [Mycolicibacterium sp.]|uniref:hypothetical protein n=2 Tax=Mycolicibacterium sp. TaxID=2320850 RepID=UPI003D0FFEFA